MAHGAFSSFLQPSACSTGVISKIKLGQQPVTDGKEHLIPLCETLEAIFRNGLKSVLFMQVLVASMACFNQLPHDFSQ